MKGPRAFLFLSISLTRHADYLKVRSSAADFCGRDGTECPITRNAGARRHSRGPRLPFGDLEGPILRCVLAYDVGWHTRRHFR